MMWKLGNKVTFTCNVCGSRNWWRERALLEHREAASCRSCHSSLRMRSMVHALSMALYGRSIPLPQFPRDKSIAGIGMSDWDGYAARLADKFDYVNTFYDRAPRMDITDLAPEHAGRYKFVLTSDVFEHILPTGLDAAFRNLRRLLSPGGILVFTVPYVKEGETDEYFPRLHDFRIEEQDGKRVLRNRTVDGEEELFDKLDFHGGEGWTLAMRYFAQPDLMRRFAAAGFEGMRVVADRVPEFGILWTYDVAVPIVARAKAAVPEGIARETGVKVGEMTTA